MQYCLFSPIAPSCMWGGAFTALHVAQGGFFSTQMLATNVGFLYAYAALQCPLEELSGRRSLLHNAIAGGALGYAGVQHGRIGIPFGHMLPAQMYRLRPPVAGAVVYGGLASVLGLLSGKPL